MTAARQQWARLSTGGVGAGAGGPARTGVAPAQKGLAVRAQLRGHAQRRHRVFVVLGHAAGAAHRPAETDVFGDVDHVGVFVRAVVGPAHVGLMQAGEAHAVLLSLQFADELQPQRGVVVHAV